MKIVFIAGPYNAQTREGIEANIANAREYAVEMARRGIGFYCPHLAIAHFHDDVKNQPEKYYYDICLQILKSCDALVAMPTWGLSVGARGEVEAAKALALPIFYPASPYDLDILANWYYGESVG